MGANLWKNARRIIIVGNADRTDIDGGQRVCKRQFQHHYPLWRFIKRKNAVLILYRGGKGVACDKQQACNKTRKNVNMGAPESRVALRLPSPQNSMQAG